LVRYGTLENSDKNGLPTVQINLLRNHSNIFQRFYLEKLIVLNNLKRGLKTTLQQLNKISQKRKLNLNEIFIFKNSLLKRYWP
jgi:hypothetical protein